MGLTSKMKPKTFTELKGKLGNMCFNEILDLFGNFIKKSEFSSNEKRLMDYLSKYHLSEVNKFMTEYTSLKDRLDKMEFNEIIHLLECKYGNTTLFEKQVVFYISEYRTTEAEDSEP